MRRVYVDEVSGQGKRMNYGGTREPNLGFELTELSGIGSKRIGAKDKLPSRVETPQRFALQCHIATS